MIEIINANTDPTVKLMAPPIGPYMGISMNKEVYVECPLQARLLKIAYNSHMSRQE